ncbi:hypothetical protein D3C86_2050170 [compost metagenome]
MELDELHISYFSLCTIYHRHTVTSSNYWIGCTGIHMACATRSHDSHIGQYLFHIIKFCIKGIYTITVDIFCTFIHMLTQMVLGNELQTKVMC